MERDTNARVLPHDIEAEKALLGAILLAPDTLDTVADTVRYYDFHRPAHKLIFEALGDMRAFGTEIDPISLRGYLEKQGNLDAAGGADYLLELQGSCVVTSNAKSYAVTVREKALFRQLVNIGMRLDTIGYEATMTPEEAVSEASNLIFGISAAQQTATLPIGTALSDLVATLKLGKQDFIYLPMLPWVHIKSGELVIVGAGTSVGKTAFSIDLADEWSKHTRVAYFEYEMSESELVARIVTKHTGIQMAEMEDGLLPEQIAAVQRVATTLSRRHMYIEAVTCDINGLLAKIRREAQRGSKVVFIDHLGLIPFSIPKGVNHAKAVGMVVTNRIKRLALELDIVIVLLSQVGREGAKRAGIPLKEDLRDSGEIEQDADKVIMLGREALMEDDSTAHVKFRQDKGLDPFAADAKDFHLIGVAVRKYRNGALGEKWLRFYGSQMRYDELYPTIGYTPVHVLPTQGALIENETDGAASTPEAA